MKRPVKVLGRNPENGQILYSRNENGEEVRGLLSPLKDGAPVNGLEIGQLERDPEGAWTLETLYDPKDDTPSVPEPMNGPPKVNSRAFRNGWDTIWGPN